MNFSQLRYFVTICEAKNMTRAAELLHIAQPALSQQIAALENKLGVRLLNRNSKGTFPTSEGLLLYRHAQTILRHVENTKALLTKKDEEVSGTVSVGMPSSTARLTALPLIKRIKQSYPGILLEVVDVPSADLASLLINGRIDFAIIPDPPKPRGISLTPIVREELYWLTPNNYKATSEPVSLVELVQYPLVLPSKPNTLRSRFEYRLVKQKLSYVLYAEASTSAILIPMVESGTANTILPSSSCHKEIQSKKIIPHSIEDGFYRNIYICVNEDLDRSAPAQLIIEVYKKIVKKMIEENMLMGWENMMK